MKKEFEDLLIEFDEMGYEPTTLCENPEREIETFRNRLKNALTELQAIKEAEPSEALEILLKAKQERLNFYGRLLDNDEKFFETLEQALIKAQEQEKKIEKLKEWFMEVNKRLENRYLTHPAQIELVKKVLEFLND